MKAEKSSPESNKKSLRKALQHEAPEEVRSLLDTWDTLEDIDREEPSFSARDTEEALAAVRSKAGLDASEPSSSPATVHPLRFPYHYAAAAAALLVIGLAGWLIIPVKVKAPRASMATASLPDGTRAELNSGSTLTYSRLFGWTNRQVALQGEAYFDVHHDASLPFTIDAGPAGIRVLGTEFNVTARDKANTTVTLLQGSLEFYPLSTPDHKIILEPGQQSVLSASQGYPSAPQRVDTDYVTAWRSGDLAFKAQSLGQIFRVLERRFDIKIETGPKVDLQEPLSLYLSHPGNVEAILNDICQVRGLRFTSIKNGYRIYR